MGARAAERETAITAADETCPRCGASGTRTSGTASIAASSLPEVTGRLAALRRRWIRRFGWYPGDWIWVSLLDPDRRRGRRGGSDRAHGFEASANVPTLAGASAVTSRPRPPSGADDRGRHLDLAAAAPEARRHPEPPGLRNGRFAWPSNENGWTIVLVSYPKTTGAASARAKAAQAAKAGLSEAGVLDSSNYASLQPGYLVVFTGVYASKADADAAVSTARQAGFAGAYSRQIAR